MIFLWQQHFWLLNVVKIDPVTQVGACIVSPDKKIVGTGYNGMPIGCDDDNFPWGKNNPSKLDNKYFYGKL